eukprot:scaffold10011_cov97-Isochrysis_galbana.AAC.3
MAAAAFRTRRGSSRSSSRLRPAQRERCALFLLSSRACGLREAPLPRLRARAESYYAACVAAAVFCGADCCDSAGGTPRTAYAYSRDDAR